MGLTTDRFKFSIGGTEYLAELRIKGEDWIYSCFRAGRLIHSETCRPAMSDYYRVHTTSVETDQESLDLTFGFIGIFKVALRVHQDGNLVWQSSEKPFRTPRRVQRFLEWAERDVNDGTKPKTQAQLHRDQQARKLRPALIVDVLFGIAFFFVAREFGLVTAAVAGAFATVILVVADRFVKADLTGGFAVFGAAMALVSAGFALAFQDDLAVKLRGSLMGLVVIVLALIDAANNGRYLGQRFARYFYALGRFDPRRASLALAGSSALIIAIDTPLAFILSTDQWIWYNAFLDGFIAMPIVFVCMWLAREPSAHGRD